MPWQLLDKYLWAFIQAARSHAEDKQMGERRMTSASRYHPYKKRSFGVDLGRPRPEHRAEIRARYPDNSTCAHLHPIPIEQRTHTNLMCHKQQWRREVGRVQQPQKAVAPPAQPVPPQCIQVAAPAMPTIDARGSQFLLVGDPSCLKGAAAALFNNRE